ncbi:hypothetical protein RD792_014795 [Penstemon davidsonii]|uniref:Uncharacterized protein n=1 Tax=Penstemon davidsonii TaxID=160366 RepID=A0ABR0CQA8_9LAMI|nr:hypothetical protein RD792_014795 [Penstemon davidsonii]
MNSTKRKTANALGGKTARPCDSCLKKRARWFCASDDAFLCQTCDASVHLANQLASRHERVRLETSSNSKGSTTHEVNSCQPTWHQGFVRKARTPRHAKHKQLQPNNSFLPVVPEINGEETLFEDENEEEQLLFRVPVFDPFANDCDGIGNIFLDDVGLACNDLNIEGLLNCEDDELAGFAADVESLLGTGNHEENGLIDELLGEKRVKVEEEKEDDVAACDHQFDPTMDMELNWDFDYASSMSNGEDHEEVKKVDFVNTSSGNESQVEKGMSLRLNHEAVIAAWATQGSPWMDGIRPQIEEFTVECLGGSGSNDLYGGVGQGRLRANDAGREARVSRYREKRRTRLFSKKIRYEVRKLNAEKRPRMKGRFVKRTNVLSGSSLPAYMMINK